MKVQMVVTVWVDADGWAAEYGCDTEKVRNDVLAYFDNHVTGAPAVADCDLKVDVEVVAA